MTRRCPRRVSFWFHSRRPFADSSAAPRMVKSPPPAQYRFPHNGSPKVSASTLNFPPLRFLMITTPPMLPPLRHCESQRHFIALRDKGPGTNPADVDAFMETYRNFLRDIAPRARGTHSFGARIPGRCTQT